MLQVSKDLFQAENNGNVMQFYPRLYGGLLRTKGYGEDWKSTHLQGCFPIGLYRGLSAVARRDPQAEPEWFIPILPEGHEDPITLLLSKDIEGRRYGLRLHYFEPLDRETTTFAVRLELEEVDEWVKHINEAMTCWPAYHI